MSNGKQLSDAERKQLEEQLKKIKFKRPISTNKIDKLIGSAIKKGVEGVKALLNKVKEDNKTFGEEKTWIAQHRKKKRHSQSPTHDQPLEQARGGLIKKYAKGGGVRKANYK